MGEEKTQREVDLEEGRLRDVTDTAKEAGLLVTVFVTDLVWDNWIIPDRDGIEQGEDEKMRLAKVMGSLMRAIRTHRRTSKSNVLSFSVSLTKEGKSENVELLSYLAPIDENDPRPSITLMLPQEYSSPSQKKN